MGKNEHLIQARKLRGWSQQRVASEVGTDEKRVSAWERGDNLPAAHFQEKLCALFGKNAEDLGFLARSIIVVSSFTMGDAMSESLDQAESIIELAWETWFASRPQQAQSAVLKILPRLEHIRHSTAAHLYTLRAQYLTIRAYGLLGAIYLDKMENDISLYHYSEALRIADEIHDIDQAVTCLALIGDVLRRKDNKIEAISRMELAREQATLHQAERATRGHILQLLAYTYADTGHAHEFESTIKEAVDLLGHSGEGLDTAQKEFIPFELYEIWGKAKRDLGSPLEAITYLDLAEKSLTNQIVTPRWYALLKISKAQALCDAGDLENGIELAENGFKMAHACQSPRQMNRVRKLARKLESNGYREDRHVKDLKELLYEYTLPS